jgi:hypothetical protein
VLPAIPSDFTWSKASLYLSPVNLGGPPGRNWLALSKAKGVTRDQCVNWGLLGEIRRCRLIISRRVSKNIRDGLSIRAVVAPQGQDPISDSVADADAVSLSSVGKLRPRLLQLTVERCLEAWIQFH